MGAPSAKLEVANDVLTRMAEEIGVALKPSEAPGLEGIKAEAPEVEAEGMSDDELRVLIEQELAAADPELLSQDIQQVLNYYDGRLPGLPLQNAGQKNLADPRASQFVSRDLQDVVESTVATVLPTLTGTTVARFQAVSPEDVEQSEHETTAVNHALFELNPGFQTVQTCLKDALLHRRGAALVRWDRRKTVSFQTFAGVPPDALPSIIPPADALPPGTSVEISELTVAETDGGPPVIEHLQIRTTSVEERLELRSIAPENLFINPDHDSPDIQAARFVAIRAYVTASDLIEQGYDEEIVEDLPSVGANMDIVERSAATATSLPSSSASDAGGTRILELYECYIQADVDGDDLAERRRVLVCGEVVLSNDPWGMVPVAFGVATLYPHRSDGVSAYDRIKGIQDSKTDLVRSIIDGTRLATAQRIGAVEGQANMLDLLHSKLGGVVRIKTPTALVPLPPISVPQEAYATVGFLDRMRSERGGTALDDKSEKLGAHQSASGVERMMSSLELGSANIARTFAETFIRSLFAIAHYTLRTSVQGAMTFPVENSFAMTVPATWPARSQVRITLGMSAGDRSRQFAALGSLFQAIPALTQAQVLPPTLFSPTTWHNLFTDYLRAAGVEQPGRYVVDPQSPEGQQAAQNAQQQQQQAKQQADALQQAQSQLQASIAQAELMKAKAGQQKVQQDGIIASLKQQLAQAEAAAASAENNAALTFDYRKLFADIALKLTEMEQSANAQLNAQYAQNMPMGY